MIQYGGKITHVFSMFAFIYFVALVIPFGKELSEGKGKIMRDVS